MFRTSLLPHIRYSFVETLVQSVQTASWFYIFEYFFRMKFFYNINFRAADFNRLTNVCTLNTNDKNSGILSSLLGNDYYGKLECSTLTTLQTTMAQTTFEPSTQFSTEILTTQDPGKMIDLFYLFFYTLRIENNPFIILKYLTQLINKHHSFYLFLY